MERGPTVHFRLIRDRSTATVAAPAGAYSIPELAINVWADIMQLLFDSLCDAGARGACGAGRRAGIIFEPSCRLLRDCKLDLIGLKGDWWRKRTFFVQCGSSLLTRSSRLAELRC